MIFPAKCSGEVCGDIALLSFVISIACGFLGMLAAVVGVVRREEPGWISLAGLALNVLPFGYFVVQILWP